MRCVTFSNVFYIFGSFMNNKFGHVFISSLLKVISFSLALLNNFSNF